MFTNENRQIKARKAWIDCYLTSGSISKTARKCGVPRSTLYRWINRYEELGIEGLKGRSKKPKKLARKIVTQEQESLILKIRGSNKFGPQQIKINLLREYDLKLSHSTIWRILKKHDVKLIKRYKPPSSPIRYNRPVPGVNGHLKPDQNDRSFKIKNL